MEMTLIRIHLQPQKALDLVAAPSFEPPLNMGDRTALSII